MRRLKPSASLPLSRSEEEPGYRCMDNLNPVVVMMFFMCECVCRMHRWVLKVTGVSKECLYKIIYIYFLAPSGHLLLLHRKHMLHL